MILGVLLYGREAVLASVQGYAIGATVLAVLALVIFLIYLALNALDRGLEAIVKSFKFVIESRFPGITETVTTKRFQRLTAYLLIVGLAVGVLTASVVNNHDRLTPITHKTGCRVQMGSTRCEQVPGITP
jgi:hypothetical protein